MKPIFKFLIVLLVYVTISCEKNQNVYILSAKSDIVSVKDEFGDSKKYNVGKYQIDYSQKSFIKLSYSKNLNFEKANAILLKVNGKYYNNFNLKEKDSLDDKSFLFLSTNTKDSYRIIEKVKTDGSVPPPPYDFKYFDDSIVFKKNGTLFKMYIKDNNTNRLKKPVIYFDKDYRIIRIIDKYDTEEIIYE